MTTRRFPSAATLTAVLAGLVACSLSSCMTEEEKEERGVYGPTSESRSIPWNEPIPGQGGGAFGALPNQPRR